MGVTETNLKRSLDEVGCSVATFSAIAGFSESRLSRAIRGLQPPNGGELQSLLEVLRSIQGLVNDASPLPISFRDPAPIRVLLRHRRAGVRLIPTPLGSATALQDFSDEFTSTSDQIAAVR